MSTLRIAMWSGPRNISTAMMRAFENRPDTEVIDEPFYACYLAASGANHPMREEVLRSQPSDWRAVVDVLLGPAPRGAPIFYQKHMTHHMLPPFGLDWMAQCRNVFLIRRPDDVVASYRGIRDEVSLDAIGVPRQSEIFAREADRLGHAPPVIDSTDVAEAPRTVLEALCRTIGIAFDECMLSWPTGRRASDGVWAPAWYSNVERSTGFAPRMPAERAQMTPDLQRIADAARPYYDAMARWKLGAAA
jgi:hypothetical protein